MKNIILNLLAITFICQFSCTALAQNSFEGSENIDFIEEQPIEVSETNFKARVIEIIDQVETVDHMGNELLLQRIKLQAVSGPNSGEEYVFEGIKSQITTNQEYKEGQIVLASISQIGEDSQVLIKDIWRVNSLYYIFAIFLILILAVGRWKGFRALISLILTFVVIMKFTVPLIISGYNPVLITVISATFIIFVSMLIIYGWDRKSQAAMSTIFISIVVALALSYLFVKFGKLTGLNEEEAIYLSDVFTKQTELTGLLLASFVLGALGVLDDVVLTQISAVEQLKKTNAHLSPKEIYQRAMQIGLDHIASMINTLFLAYAGASFFLLFLIQSGRPPFNDFLSTINNEIVATEIIRTIAGSIGLVLAIPIATYIASHYFFRKAD